MDRSNQMNPKRVEREVCREMEKMKETSNPLTLAQDHNARRD